MKPPRHSLAPILVAALLAGCSEQTLAPRVCDPGALRCRPDGTYDICVASGTAWVVSSCPVGEACITTTCGGAHLWPDDCRPIVCNPGRRRCNPTDNVRIEVCDESGTDWCCVGSCAVPQIDGVCFDGRCVSVCNTVEKSYLGCDYYAVDLDNANVPCGQDDAGNLIYCDASAAQFAVVLSNPDTAKPAVYQVTTGPPPPAASLAEECATPTHIAAAGVLPPKGLGIVELPRRDVNGTVKAKLAYRVTANAPITAYQFNPLENVEVFSNDASLLLPTNTLDRRYYVMTREQTFDDLKGFLTVIGVEEQPTQVTVTVTAPTLAGPGIPALQPGQSFTTMLERYEVLNIATNWIGSDLTGSLIVADQPVAAFGGSEAANAPNTSRCNLDTGLCAYDGLTPCACTPAEGPLCNPHAKCSAFITCCADHLEQQLFPVGTWGTAYVGVRSMPRGTIEQPGQELDVWRVLAAEDRTQAGVEPPFVQIPELRQGEWFEFETNEDFILTSTKPVLLGQFLAAEQAPNPGFQDGDARTGDPAFILAVPIRQFRTDYVFLAPNKYADDYVSIAAPVGSEPRLDGVLVESLEPDVRQLQINPIAGTPWLALRARIADGFHVLTCREPCMVMVHGYDQYVSYGYPGGLNLEE